MSEIMNQLSNEQRSEIKRQMNIYEQGISDIIPTEELKEKIAKSIIQNQPLKIKLGRAVIIALENNLIIQVGKRKFAKIILNC